MTHANTILCPFCEQPTDPTDFTHACNDCNVARDHEPQATWTTIGETCFKGFPDCAKGDGHAEGCVGA